jgi:5-methylcytosine-specific restriction endonuclease McrA
MMPLVPPAKSRRRNTVAQAKNMMRRAVAEILDPSPSTVEGLWEHFESQCAYCGRQLRRTARDGHVDHAEPGGGNQLGNLLLACRPCNGDEKREQAWREFLRTKATGATFAEREARIRAWFRLHPRVPVADSAEIARVRAELDGLIDQFGGKCAQLKQLVSHHESGLDRARSSV